MKLFIGLMSGTSMDGIDAALVDLNTNTLIAGITRPYSDKAKQFLQEVLVREQIKPAMLDQLNTLLGREFALAVHQLMNKANMSPQRVVAIGSHGQTICHDATADIPYTVQLGCAHTIAELTRMVVVADFRTRDLVMGGQGAPFAPIYHQALFADRALPLAVVNLGGIANVSYIAEGVAVSGYDVGPGNCLMDAWIQKNRGQSYDDSGAWAATGEMIMPLLSALLSDPFVTLPSPKSVGKEYYSMAWLTSHLRPEYAAKDVQATLLAYTATIIADDIKKREVLPKCVAICGGGVHNLGLQDTLVRLLPGVEIESTEALGVDPDYMEAMMFAWLADKAISQTPLDFRSITGAKNLAVYGAIYGAGIDKKTSIEA